MRRNGRIVGTVLFVTGTLFAVAGAVALAAGYTVAGVVLLAIGLSDIAARFVIARGTGRSLGADESAGSEVGGEGEPGGESTNPYARED